MNDELDVVVPQVRAFGRRRLRWAFVVAALLLVPGAMLVRHTRRTEATLAAMNAAAERVVAQELRPGRELRIPIQAESEAVRIVSHAFGDGPLDEALHDADLSVVIEGRGQRRTESLVLPLPGVRLRTMAEEPEVVVGDPYGATIDTAGVGPGQVVVTLRSIARASGVLTRAFVRNALSARERAHRSTQLDEPQLARLSLRAWESAWTDLSTAERDTVLGFRWRGVASVGGSVVSRALAVAPRDVLDAGAGTERTPLVRRAAVEPGMRLSFMARRAVTLVASSEGTPALLHATVRSANGDVTERSAATELRLDVPTDGSVGIEADAATTLAVHTEDPLALVETSSTSAWRAMPGHPVLVSAAPREATVLEVTARAVLRRPAPAPAEVQLRGAVGASRFVHVATLARSPFDRYPSQELVEVPSEPSRFFVTVPAGETLSLEADVPVDLVLAELDREAPPKPLGYPAKTPPLVRARGAASTWRGFVARRPSNAPDLEERRLDLGPELVPNEAVVLPSTVHVRRPRSLRTRLVDAQVFVEGRDVELDVVTAGVRLSVPVHLLTTAPVTVTVVPGGPRGPTTTSDLAMRRTPGFAKAVTLTRVIEGADTRAVVVVGDDLPPGPKKLRFHSEAPFALHVPWEQSPMPPHWSEGDYEP